MRAFFRKTSAFHALYDQIEEGEEEEEEYYDVADFKEFRRGASEWVGKQKGS